MRKKAKAKRTVSQSKTLLRKQIFIGLALSTILGLLLTAVYYFTHIESLQITKVEVHGGKTVPHEKVVDITKDTFGGSYLKLIPKSFRTTFPISDVINRIEAIDRIKSAKVELSDDTVVVNYDEYTPVALWCGVNDDGQCLFLDGEGFAFTVAPSLDGGSFIRFVVDDNEPEKLKTALSKESLQDSLQIAETLQAELGWYVIKVVVTGDYDTDYLLAGGAVLKTSQTMSNKTTLKNLLSIVHSQEFSQLQPDNFRYIDLRFGDKVFVNDDMSESAPEADLEADSETDPEQNPS